jgi:uracil-DNA glycosylase
MTASHDIYRVLDGIPRVHPAWLSFFNRADIDQSLQVIDQHLQRASVLGSCIYPKQQVVFKAFEFMGPDQIRVLMVGQDPYHQVGQAMGLAFSTPNHHPRPPSLRHILQEYAADLGLPIPTSHDLTSWCQQGVLLLNSGLTVADSQPNAHASLPWYAVTNAVIQHVSEQSPACVFMLWGKVAQAKQALIDTRKHKILMAPHPSPLSAYRGFFGSRPFTQANHFLVDQGWPPIDWSLD